LTTTATLTTDPVPPSHPVQAVPGSPAWPRNMRLVLRLAGAAVMLIWLVGLVAFSTILYHRNDLTADFGTYNQAWTLIGQGHLNPLDTVFIRTPFLKSDFELIMWPLALIHLAFPQPVVLLWLQDLAVAASGFVVYLWITDYLDRRRVAWWVATGVATVVLVAIVINPGVYQTLLFDFHLEPLSTVFILLAGRDLWWGRHRRAWIWVAIALLFGSFAAITIVGLGVSALLASRDTRRQGVLLVIAGVAWLGLISVVGANSGSGLDYYAYLAGRSSLTGSSGVVLIVTGMLAHPSRVINMLHERLHYIWVLIKPVGVVGLASAWGFGVPVVVILTNALNSQYGFIFQAFQNSAVFSFVLLGTVMVLVWLAQRFRFGWIPCVVIALAVTIQAVSYGYTTSPGNIRWAISRVDAADAAQLNKALTLTPSDAEVIATIGIMGRFSGRTSIYFFVPKGTVPIKQRTVVFVFDPANENTIPQATSADDLAAAAFVRGQLHARVLVDADGVTVFEWQPPAGTTHLTFPPTPATP
jgi:uncharacterized membrane protein